MVYTVILPIVTAPRGIQELRGSSFGFLHRATSANQPSPPRNHAPERMAAVVGTLGFRASGVLKILRVLGAKRSVMA